MSRKLVGRGLHTWHGMLGYCMKDKFKPHYREYHTDNITAEDKQVAEDAYLQFGAGDNKNKCVISPNTKFDRASTYYQLRLGGLRKVLEDVLLSMCRTGKYVPSGSWVIPYSRQGMDKQRANSAWLMMTFPAEVRVQDVNNVFFGGVTNHRYFEVEAKDEPELLQVHDGILSEEPIPSVCDIQQPDAMDMMPLLPEMSVGPSAEQVVALCKMNAAMLIHTTDI